MTLLMDDSLKLSYDMLFENGAGQEESGSNTSDEDESQAISPEKIKQRLKENDKQWQKR